MLQKALLLMDVVIIVLFQYLERICWKFTLLVESPGSKIRLVELQQWLRLRWNMYAFIIQTSLTSFMSTYWN